MEESLAALHHNSVTAQYALEMAKANALGLHGK